MRAPVAWPVVYSTDASFLLRDPKTSRANARFLEREITFLLGAIPRGFIVSFAAETCKVGFMRFEGMVRHAACAMMFARKMCILVGIWYVGASGAEYSKRCLVSVEEWVGYELSGACCLVFLAAKR